jgi:hypothetical protein
MMPFLAMTQWLTDIANLTFRDHNIQEKLVLDLILALCSGQAMPSSEAILNDINFGNTSVAGSANLTLRDHGIMLLSDWQYQFNT